MNIKTAILRVFCLLLASGVSLNLCAAPAYVEPPIVEEILSIDGVRVDGSLNLTYDLGAWVLGPHQKISFNIVHRLRTNSFGHTISEMTVTGLAGLAVPTERSLTRCVLPGGEEITFNSESLGVTFTRIGAGLMARRPAPDRWEIGTADGWRWAFDHGVLVAGLGPDLLKLAVESQGTRITRLRAMRLGGMVGELVAEYDSMGRLKELKFGGQSHRFLYEGPQHQMTEWVATADGKETKTRFAYDDDVLVRVTKGGVVQRELQWERVPGGLTADTDWPAPLRVSKIGETHFSYDLGYKGYVMEAKNSGTKTTQKRILNPMRGTIDVIENGELQQRIYFGAHRSQSNAGKVLRVEDGRRNLIAGYDYDSYGRVSVFTFGLGNSDERIEFEYDQSGRHQKIAPRLHP